MKLRRASEVSLLSLLVSTGIYYFFSAVVVAVGVLGQFTRYLNVPLHNGNGELTAEEVQRPTLDIESDLSQATFMSIMSELPLFPTLF